MPARSALPAGPERHRAGELDAARCRSSCRSHQSPPVRRRTPRRRTGAGRVGTHARPGGRPSEIDVGCTALRDRRVDPARRRSAADGHRRRPSCPPCRPQLTPPARRRGARRVAMTASTWLDRPSTPSSASRRPGARLCGGPARHQDRQDLEPPHVRARAEPGERASARRRRPGRAVCAALASSTPSAALPRPDDTRAAPVCIGARCGIPDRASCVRGASSTTDAPVATHGIVRGIARSDDRRSAGHRASRARSRRPAGHRARPVDARASSCLASTLGVTRRRPGSLAARRRTPAPSERRSENEWRDRPVRLHEPIIPAACRDEQPP